MKVLYQNETQDAGKASMNYSAFTKKVKYDHISRRLIYSRVYVYNFDLKRQSC